MNKLICITGMMILLQGCVKETAWPVKNSIRTAVIVEATLTDEVKTQKVILHHSVSELNEVPAPVSGAGVVISNEDSVWTLKESQSEPGTYLTPAFFTARLDKTYNLIISDKDKIYSARATMVPGAYFSELQYAMDQPGGLYHINWVASAFSTSQAAMWEVLLDWSDVPGYETTDSSETHSRLLFYTLPTLDVSEIFAPEVEAVRFPRGTVITERRYSLTDDHAEFFRELLLETNWTGGLFNTASANVSTNLSNGALGFFGVCSVTELSLIVQ